MPLRLSWLYTFFPTTTSSWLLTGYDLALPVAQFRRVSVVFAVLSALHAYALLVMVVASIRERRLSFSIGGSTWKLFTRCRLKLAAPHSSHGRISTDFFVACIVVNCWSAPVVKRLVRRDIPRQRVWCVAFDVALDFVSTIVVPTTIFVTYYEAFDVAKNDFSSDSYFVGSFLIHVVTEFQIFWVQSWLDLVLRVLFALNLINCLDVIKTMIRRRRDRAHAVKAEQPDKQPPPSGQRGVSHFLHAFGRAAFLVGGAAVLAVYLYAVTRREVPQCVLQVHPWLTAKPSCASLELNCPLAGIAGAEADVDRVLAALHEPSLVFVYLRHCPALHVPPRTHPNMRMFSLVRVRTDSFPGGLLASSFPQKLTDMSLIDVNLTAAQVPADLDTKWSQVLYLYWEQSELLEVPAAITRLPQLVDLSLSGNHISSVPAALLSLPSLWALRINGNPVRALPDPPGLAVSPWLGCLSLESTQYGGDWTRFDFEGTARFDGALLAAVSGAGRDDIGAFDVATVAPPSSESALRFVKRYATHAVHYVVTHRTEALRGAVAGCWIVTSPTAEPFGDLFLLAPAAYSCDCCGRQLHAWERRECAECSAEAADDSLALCERCVRGHSPAHRMWSLKSTAWQRRRPLNLEALYRAIVAAEANVQRRDGSGEREAREFWVRERLAREWSRMRRRPK
ncbi:hypothetical protein P43SY_005816 [Pythium insidiosum]|uniref:TKL protein kinase n=1 Tax=Pythium insidiosum TaxID=114742 RepID=A0AAD5LQS4_PYTIN|nr:hypothetical protein P43SY_005816 [Pythium insidiosum]